MSSAVDPARLEGVPAARPPPGVSPNFVDPRSSGPVLIAVGTVLLVVMLLCVTIRGYTKIRIAKKITPDDYTCSIAALGTIFYFVAAVYSVAEGHFGTHMWDLTASDVASDAFLWSGFFTNWMTTIIWPFAKLTFFLLYIQIFRPIKWLRYCSYAGAIVNVLFYFSIFVATMAFTAPAPGQTILEAVQSSRQIKALSTSLPVACMSFVLDVYILLLPIAGVSKLQLPLRRKLGVMAVFFTGLTACIASALSIYYKYQLINDPSDVTYKTMYVVLMSLIEMCVGVSASCMPSMSKVLHRTPSWSNFSSSLVSHLSLGRLFSKESKSSGSEQPYNKPHKAKYSDLERYGPPCKQSGHNMAILRPMQTHINAGVRGETESNGIRLYHTIEQESIVDTERQTSLEAW